MSTRLLYIISGVSGSGKSTLARDLVDDEHVCEADKFRMVDGRYVFDPDRNSEMHALCVEAVRDRMAAGVLRIAVANVFSRPEYVEPYLQLALAYGYRVRIFDLGTGGLSDGQLAARNLHAVPADAIAKMRTGSERLPYAQTVSSMRQPSFVHRHFNRYASLFNRSV